jgi:flagellin-like protein
MVSTKKNEEAVSPVIGVILMVAVTVILAAIIAAFVFGMAGNLTQGKTVAATAQHKGTNIWVTYQGGQDNSKLVSYDVFIGVGTDAKKFDQAPPTVGNSTAFSPYSGTNNHVVVVGNFNDGVNQTILDTYV